MKFEVTLEFEKSLKRLSKKYKSLKDDYIRFLDELEKNPLMGDEIFLEATLQTQPPRAAILM